MKKSFIFYKSFYDAIHRVQNKELKADIFEAICELALYSNDIELTDEVGQMIMDLIKPQIQANNERYENGKKGGRPKEKTDGFSKEKTSGYLKDKTNGSKIKKPNVNENDNVNVNDNENIKGVVGGKKYFDDNPTNELFIEFLQVRKKLKAVNSDRAIKMLINKLSSYDEETKRLMIEQSIVHSWKDVYELKDKKQNVPSWFNNELKEKELSDEQKRILEKIR